MTLTHAFIFRSFSISYHIASCQSGLAPRSSDIIQDTLWVLFKWSVNTRKRLEVLPTGPDEAYSPCKSPSWKKRESAAELSCSLGEQMLRLAKSTVMLARRADPSLGEGRAFQKYQKSFGPELSSFKAHKLRNLAYKYQSSQWNKPWTLAEQKRPETGEGDIGTTLQKPSGSSEKFTPPHTNPSATLQIRPHHSILISLSHQVCLCSYYFTPRIWILWIYEVTSGFAHGFIFVYEYV
jgi:hypothetical protein